MPSVLDISFAVLFSLVIVPFGGAFFDRLETVAAAFAEGARLPGARRFAARDRALKQGIEVDAAALATLERLAGVAA